MSYYKVYVVDFFYSSNTYIKVAVAAVSNRDAIDVAYEEFLKTGKPEPPIIRSILVTSKGVEVLSLEQEMLLEIYAGRRAPGILTIQSRRENECTTYVLECNELKDGREFKKNPELVKSVIKAIGSWLCRTYGIPTKRLRFRKEVWMESFRVTFWIEKLNSFEVAEFQYTWYYRSKKYCEWRYTSHRYDKEGCISKGSGQSWSGKGKIKKFPVFQHTVNYLLYLLSRSEE